jgi:hypothetical protein
MARGARVNPSTATLEEPARRLSWVERLKRVFKLDLEHCPRCGGTLHLIAAIDDPAVIERILAHLERRVSPGASRAPPSSERPVQLLLFV